MNRKKQNKQKKTYTWKKKYILEKNRNVKGMLLSTIEETICHLQVLMIHSTLILPYMGILIYPDCTYLFYSSALWETAFCLVYRSIIFPKGTMSGWSKYIVILALSSRKFSVCSLKREANNYIYLNDIMFYSTCHHFLLNSKQVCSL